MLEYLRQVFHAKTPAHASPVHCLPGIAVVFDVAGAPREWNRQLENVTGFSSDEIRAMRPDEFVMPADRDALTQCMSAAWRGGREEIEVRLRCKNGDELLYQCCVLPQLIGKQALILLAGLDASDRHHARSQQRLAGAVFDASHAGIMITDLGLNIVSVNPAFTGISGYTLEEVRGRKPSVLSSGHHDALFYRAMWRAICDNGYWQGEIWNRRKSGEVFPEWLTISAVRDADGLITHYVGVFSDISERKAAEARVAFLAKHDSLTHLPNRVLLRDRVTQALNRAGREGEQLALLFLDLDNFKTINDSLGHTVGDRVLLQLAAILTDCIRTTDTVCRQGGDEFVILLTQIQDASAAAAIAQKVLSRLSEPLLIDGHTLRASFSIGISVFPGDGDDFESLCKHADAAMYHAKESGRNTFRFFTPELDGRALERLRMEHLLREALLREELCLHYQPQMNLRTGRVIGVEALLRWTSAELGEVAPANFVPVAEQCGLIVPIGGWVLREACRQCRRWRDAGYDLIMAVNLSAVQLRQDDLVDDVRDALQAADLPGACLELELTESLLMDNTRITRESLQDLKGLGVRLAIDDFGTGFSSLGYLKRFAVDQLKIDRSFVADMIGDEHSALIVRSVIDLAHNLGLRVVAEGVEGPAALDALRRLACDTAQGYLLGRPQSAARLEERLRQPGMIGREADIKAG